MALRNGLSECGDSSPLLLAATCRGESSTADKSAVGKAGASSRTPKIAVARPYRLFGVTAGIIARKAAYRPRLTPPFLSPGEKSGLKKSGRLPLQNLIWTSWSPTAAPAGLFHGVRSRVERCFHARVGLL